jgi:hypothetical protein
VSSKFQARHYEAIAAVMARKKPHPVNSGNATAQWEDTCYALAQMFAGDNRNFRQPQFLSVCGLEVGNADTHNERTPKSSRYNDQDADTAGEGANCSTQVPPPSAFS